MTSELWHKLHATGMIATGVLGCLAVLHSSAQEVSTDYDHKADFHSYHTFSFAKVDTANPLFEQRVRDAITQSLQGKGLQMTPSGGDVAVTAIGDVKNQQEYTTFYNGLGPDSVGVDGEAGTVVAGARELARQRQPHKRSRSAL